MVMSKVNAAFNGRHLFTLLHDLHILNNSVCSIVVYDAIKLIDKTRYDIYIFEMIAKS